MAGVELEGETDPVEISRLRLRLKPLTEKHLSRIRYHVPKPVQSEARRLPTNGRFGMTTPFVLDNLRNRLADTLNQLLEKLRGKPLDIATAYFSISGYRILKDGLHELGPSVCCSDRSPSRCRCRSEGRHARRGQALHPHVRLALKSIRHDGPLAVRVPARLLRPLTRTARARPRNRATDVQEKARQNGSCSAGVGRRGQPLVSLPQPGGGLKPRAPGRTSRKRSVPPGLSAGGGGDAAINPCGSAFLESST